MPSWKKPTADQVQRAIALLGHPERMRYFLEKLENPLWLEPLRDMGFFRYPPPPTRDEVRKTIGFPFWPRSKYLARAAREPEVQDLALTIALEIPRTENTRVYEDLADVALALPPRLAVRLAAEVPSWLSTGFLLLLPGKLGELMSHLARGAEIEGSLELARRVLAVRPDPNAPKGPPGEEEFRWPLEPRGLVDDYEYQQILKKHFSGVVKGAGVKALELLSSLLLDAIRLSQREPDRTFPEDYSYIWRPDIESSDHEDLKEALVSATRDAAAQVLASAPDQIHAVVEVLEGKGWRIFHRLCLWSLAKSPGHAVDAVRERLTDKSLFEDEGYRTEYSQLARAAVSLIDEASLRVILQWIDTGLDTERLARNYEAAAGHAPPKDMVERAAKTWQRDRLAPFVGALPPDWDRRLRQLVLDVGAPSQERPQKPHAEWVGESSPKTAAELRQMGVDDLAAFLRSWIPQKSVFGTSREGLGEQLTAAVSADPNHFALQAGVFHDIDLALVRALLYGWRDATKQKRPFDWREVLSLSERATVQGGRDPEPAWTRKAVADLLSAGFEDGDAQLLRHLREQAWRILKVLLEDSDPAPQREVPVEGSAPEPVEVALNSTRGEAMHAAVKYGLWIRRQFEADKDAVRLSAGFEQMPELRDALERRLGIEVEPSLAIRSVFGQWFPWLVLLDASWARQRVPAIFPGDPRHAEYRRVAWETYVTFCTPYDNVVSLLEGEYSHAVEELSGGERGKRRRDPDRRLADHLMALYWRGRLTLAPGNLLANFFSRAVGELRGGAFEILGRGIAAVDESIPAEALARVHSLWEWRWKVTSKSPDDHQDELASFGWLFGSGKLDPEWSLSQLALVLKAVGKAEPNFLVGEMLEKLVVSYPLRAVTCLSMMIEGDRDGWLVLAIRDNVRTIISAALACADAAAQEEAKHLVNRLGERGYHEYRDLLGR